MLSPSNLAVLLFALPTHPCAIHPATQSPIPALSTWQSIISWSMYAILRRIYPDANLHAVTSTTLASVPPSISNPDTFDSFTSYWDSPTCGKITMHFSRSTQGTPVWNPPDVVGGHYTEMNQPLPWPPSIGIDTALEASRRQGFRRGFYVVTYCWDFLGRQPIGVPIYWFGARDGGWAVRVDNQDVRPYGVGDGLNESALQDPS